MSHRKGKMNMKQKDRFLISFGLFLKTRIPKIKIIVAEILVSIEIGCI
jgi:hypothetical protein